MQIFYMTPTASANSSDIPRYVITYIKRSKVLAYFKSSSNYHKVTLISVLSIRNASFRSELPTNAYNIIS